MRTKNRLFNLCFAGIFAALAYISTFVIYITVSGFLTYDVKDALITVCSMIIGPVYAVAISLIVSFIELITISGTGFWGFLMNFVSSAVFAAVASLIYKRKGKLVGAFVGLGTAVVATTAVMVLMNMVITPIYVGQSRELVMSLIPTLLLPFNLSKAVLNSALVLLFYKPFVKTMRRLKLLPRKDNNENNIKNTVVTVLVSVVLIAVSCVVLFWFLNGSFSLV